MKWYKILDGIGSGCTSSMIAAGVAIGIASSVGIWNNLSANNLEIDERVHDVLLTAGVIISFGTVGATASTFLISRLDDIEVDNTIDYKWEMFVSIPEAWNGQYCASACKGCKHLIGRVNISENKFMVCAMHPYGWREGECPDWASRKL